MGGVLLFAFAILGLPSFAAVHNDFGQQLNASQCNQSGAPILNITYKITNDPDSGVAQNPWANDNYNKKVQVWDQGNGNFCAIVKYQGQFVTTGPLSPEKGVALRAGIKGAFEGGYQATFIGTFEPGANQINGNLGLFDQSKEGFDWLGTYFSGYSGFTQPFWSWTYHGGNNGTWVNAITGNMGDITGN